MDKKLIVEKIRQQLEADLKILQDAALATYEAATNEESKPENEYDTRAVEASYLAGAQAKRVAEIEEQLTMLKFLQLKSFTEDTPLHATALIQVEHDGKKNWLFLLQKGGGLSIDINNMYIQVVTPISPLGEALIGLTVGDVAVVDRGNKTLQYEILSAQ